MIFLSFYQSIAIVVLVHMHVLSSRTLNIKDYDIKDVSNGLQEFIICVEMFVAAVAHLVAFPVSDFVSLTSGGHGSGIIGGGSSASRGDTDAAPGGKLSSVLDVLDMSDVYVDVRDRAESVGGRVVERVKAATVGALGVSFSSGNAAAKASKVKLDALDPDDGAYTSATSGADTARLLPPSGDAAPGVIDLSHSETRDNLPFLNASGRQHTRRPGALSPRALELAAAQGQTSVSASTVSIGGVQIPLSDLLEGTAVRSPR